MRLGYWMLSSSNRGQCFLTFFPSRTGFAVNVLDGDRVSLLQKLRELAKFYLAMNWGIVAPERGRLKSI